MNTFFICGVGFIRTWARNFFQAQLAVVVVSLVSISVISIPNLEAKEIFNQMFETYRNALCCSLFSQSVWRQILLFMSLFLNAVG